MKLLLLLAFALACTACDNVISNPDPTPAPETPIPATPVGGRTGVAPAPGVAGAPGTSPAPKPGAWMYESKSGLDKSGKLGEKGKK